MRLVFVSHAGEDTWVARQIAKEISARGARTFLDRANVDVGAAFEDELRKSLAVADEFVGLFTPWSMDRPYVWAEAGAAWLRGIPIVSVLHGISVQSFLSYPEVPNFLKSRDMVRLNDLDVYFEQLGARIRREDENVR